MLNRVLLEGIMGWCIQTFFPMVMVITTWKGEERNQTSHSGSNTAWTIMMEDFAVTPYFQWLSVISFRDGSVWRWATLWQRTQKFKTWKWKMLKKPSVKAMRTRPWPRKSWAGYGTMAKPSKAQVLTSSKSPRRQCRIMTTYDIDPRTPRCSIFFAPIACLTYILMRYMRYIKEMHAKRLAPTLLFRSSFPQLLPGSEAYLGRIIVKKESEIPPDADRTKYLTKHEDFMLRASNVNKEASTVVRHFCTKYGLFHIVSWVIHLKIHLSLHRLERFVDEVLKSTIGVTDYVIRWVVLSLMFFHQ